MRSVSLLVVALLAWLVVDVAAADEWIEVKSAHFTVVSNASERSTRKLVWQLEQVRSAMAALWSWAKADLNKPLTVIILKDQNSMRALAPQYWEQRRSIRPASVWMTARDAHYVALRTDVEVHREGTINPYITAYASYIELMIGQSLSRDLPLWFSRGFAGVVSNTIVRDDHILFGAPIPWHLEILRQRASLSLPKLLSVTRQSPEANEAVRREVFDAETWAFLHFLMFGDEGARADKLNVYVKLVRTGSDAAKAFVEVFGPAEALDSPFRAYFQRTLFSYRRVDLDVSVERERFPIRPVPPAESASVRALFHAAMDRPVESRAAIAEARKTDPTAPGSYVAEGLLADRDDKTDEAKAAYRKASEFSTTSPYAYYRLAQLTWQPNASRDLFAEIEKHLTKAIALNDRYAPAYAWLGETNAFLGTGESVSLIRRAIVIEPNEAHHRLRLAGVLLRQGKPAEARIEAQAALTLADTDEERRDAERLVASATKAAATAAARTAPLSTAPPAATAPATAAVGGASNPSPGIAPGSLEDMQALDKSCQSGDNTACGRLLPVVEVECAQKVASACGFAGFLHERGRGVAADAARAAGFYRQSCDAGDRMGCVGFALLQARGIGVTKDGARAQATLNELCAGGLLEACTELAILVVPGGTPADLARGRELLTKACDGQHARACELLKSMPTPTK